MDGAFLDWALEDCAGYVAVDERYAGPSCVLAAVENRRDKRVRYAVLDHAPTHEDSEAFLGRLQTAFDARDRALHGSTTDGSALYPEPMAKVCGAVPHQLGTCHGIAALVKGVLRAVAAERERLAQSTPPVQRGRPASKDKAARRLARTRTRLQQQRSAIFQHRLLCVQRHLTRAERTHLGRLTRGMPHRRTLREIMEHVYALFDRRCRTPTALGKLAKLRGWVTRFTWRGDTWKKVFSPTLENALTLLDDKLLPATSHAVERGNRRHRQRQKSVYRIRSKGCLVARIALEMIREAHAEGRQQTTQALHDARMGAT